MSELTAVPGDDLFENKDEATYILKLFITGASPNSIRAVANTKKICEKYLKDRFELEVIDIHQQPTMAEKEELIALPLLIRKRPLPERRLIGDMSDLKRVLAGLEIKEI